MLYVVKQHITTMSGCKALFIQVSLTCIVAVWTPVSVYMLVNSAEVSQWKESNIIWCLWEFMLWSVLQGSEYVRLNL